MTYTYSPNIPQPGDFPSQSQDQILQNYQYLNVFGARDHYMPTSSGTANTGTHKQVTLSNIAAPGFAGGNSALFANTDGTNSQLFFQNAAGTVQLTSNAAGVPTIGAQGVTSLPGGLLLQWDSALVGGFVSQVFTFSKAFSAPPYSITLGGQNLIDTQAAVGRITAAPSNTAFTFQNRASQACTFYYMAIGPA